MPVYQASARDGPLRQSEILSNLPQAHLHVEALARNEPDLVVSIKVHDLAIVVSQDCDLEQDHRARVAGEMERMVPSVLFCEIESVEALLRRVPQGRDISKRILSNSDERYQFLEQVPPECDAMGEGLPELGIDFKRYFSIPTAEVYLRLQRETRRRTVLVSPYLEHFSIRFARFQSRVALPQDHRRTEVPPPR